MLRPILFASLFCIAATATAQYKNDNVLFKTVDPSELCVTLDKNSGYLLLDVRSKGEHYDTSSFAHLNVGKLKGARNIDIRDLPTRISEIQAYKDKPIFVYCSHSQRSRRAGKILADSGFTKVFNINGGMTALHYSGKIERDCNDDLMETMNVYRIISANELCEKIKMKEKQPFIVDVRADSAWNRTGSSASENAYGSIKSAVHISLANLDSLMKAIPKSRQEIIVVDLSGDQASQAAVMLKQKGYENVSVLIEGIVRLLQTDEQDLPCKKEIYKPAVTYQFLNSSEFGRFIAANKKALILDVRTSDEFANKHKDTFRNIGHLKDAVHIPAAELSARISEIQKFKDKEVALYTFSSGPEVFAAANTLQQQGFSKVNVIVGGIFNIRWTAANKKGKSALKDLVEDVPEINW